MKTISQKIFYIIIAILLLIAGFYLLNNYIYNEKQAKQVKSTTDFKDIELNIEGQQIKLEDGYAEEKIGENLDSGQESSSRIITKYFGNELKTDLNNDGKEDITFIITQDRGGSGLFYYAVAAIATDKGYIGSDGYLLGDRIAPQPTNLSPNPRHKNVVVFNYADRALTDPMTTPPSVGKSVYLKIDPESLLWGIVEPDFEGESR